MPTRPLALAVALALAGCSRGGGTPEQALPQPGSPAARPADGEGPLDALRLTADQAAARLGSFAWEGEVTWTVSKPGATPVRAAEHHRVRQLASGDFEVSADLDPGSGPGSDTGKQIVYAGGATYAHGKWAPFRERPTDRGRDARRFRDESFQLAADLVRLYGPAFRAEPAGEATFLGRRARRYTLALTAMEPAQPPPAPAALPPSGYDPATRKRLDFLEGRVPKELSGELLVDAETGVPLSVTLRGSFSQQSDAQLRADVDLAARVRSLGSQVAAVQPPRGALADDRKPKGVARALEAAGLRQREGAATEEADEPQADE